MAHIPQGPSTPFRRPAGGSDGAQRRRALTDAVVAPVKAPCSPARRRHRNRRMEVGFTAPDIRLTQQQRAIETVYVIEPSGLFRVMKSRRGVVRPRDKLIVARLRPGSLFDHARDLHPLPLLIPAHPFSPSSGFPKPAIVTFKPPGASDLAEPKTSTAARETSSVSRYSRAAPARKAAQNPRSCAVRRRSASPAGRQHGN